MTQKQFQHQLHRTHLSMAALGLLATGVALPVQARESGNIGEASTTQTISLSFALSQPSASASTSGELYVDASQEFPQESQQGDGAIAPIPNPSSSPHSPSHKRLLPSPALIPPTGMTNGEHRVEELPPPPSSSDEEGDTVVDTLTAALFRGGSESLVAIAIGNAEGTRTVEGGKTSAYYGHTDPGNHAWNLGTFSYQHGAASSEEADQKQLSRLSRQSAQLHEKARANGILLTDEIWLNALDLANQSPLAALGRGGFMERLRQAYGMGMTGSEAILWARTRSYLDPDTGRWNAPGLGNTVQGVTEDQSRRQRAIAQVLTRYSGGDRPAAPTDLSTDHSTRTLPAVPSSEPSTPETDDDSAPLVDYLLSLDL